MLFLMGFLALGAVPGDVPPALEDTAGRVTLVNFWASWCGPCRTELPLLEALDERLDDNLFAVRTVNIDVQPQRAEALLKRNELDLSVTWDPTGVLAAAYDPPAMPTTYIIAPNGRVIKVLEGGLSHDELSMVEAELRALASPES
jgi:thiol-disulfide isomerase/thioredoxin